MGRGQTYDQAIFEAIIQKHLPGNDEDWKVISSEYQAATKAATKRKVDHMKRFWKKCCGFGSFANTFHRHVEIRCKMTEACIQEKIRRSKAKRSTTSSENGSNKLRKHGHEIDNDFNRDAKCINDMYEMIKTLHNDTVRSQLEKDMVDGYNELLLCEEMKKTRNISYASGFKDALSLMKSSNEGLEVDDSNNQTPVRGNYIPSIDATPSPDFNYDAESPPSHSTTGFSPTP
jgi:hypothetical protein